jgi:cell shape-determining protein MreD
MRWVVVIVVAWVALGLELGLREFLTFSGPGAAGAGGSAPSFVLPLVVFIALFAPQLSALWTALVLGLALDLASPRGEGAVIVAGPHAIAFVCAAYLVLVFRPVLMRRNPLTLAFASVLGGLLAAIIVCAFFTVRMVYTNAYAWSPMSELGQRLIGALATGLTALFPGSILLLMHPLFGFPDHHGRRSYVRRT